MKIQTNVVETSSNAVFDETTRMSIDGASFQHIVRVLTELYSDPAQSIVREYSANGLDSHILAGQTKPVEVTFPSYLNASFVVRDFGVGMSRDEMQSIYSKYGASTKRDTNDQIGAFGLGAKSALALVASFTVASIKDGKQNVVIIAKDEDGVSSLNFLPEQPTEEPNGVTVTVPVTNVRDFDRVKALNIFLGWQPGAVLVDGKAPESIHDATNFTDLGGAGWFSITEQTINHRGGLRAMVGPVSYEIPYATASNLLTQDLLGGWHIGTLNSRLVLNLPNGSVALTPSREALIFNRQTNEAIKAAAVKAIPEILPTLLTQIDKAETRRGAFKIASQANSFLRPQEEVSLTWQGEQFHIGYPSTGLFNKTHFLDSEREAEGTVEAPAMGHITMRYKSATAMQTSPLLPQSELNVGGADFDRFVIITEAARNSKGGYIVASYLSSWMRTSTKLRHIRFFLTHKSAAELNENFVAMANTVISAADVRTAVLATRKKAVRRPAGTPATPAAPKVITVSVLKSGAFYGNKSQLATVALTDLDAERTYVIAQATGDRGAGKMTLENAVYCYFRNSKNLDWKQDRAIKSVIDLLGRERKNLIVLPQNANREEILKALPNTVDIEANFAALFTTDSLTEAEREYVRFTSRRNRGYFGSRLGTQELFAGGESAPINKVNNETSREFLALFAARGATRAAALNLAAAQADSFTTSISVAETVLSAVKEFRTLAHEEGTRIYPLLTSEISSEAASDAVDYINMVDARNN